MENIPGQIEGLVRISKGVCLSIDHGQVVDVQVENIMGKVLVRAVWEDNLVQIYVPLDRLMDALSLEKRLAIS